MQAKMHCAVDDKKGSVTSTNNVAHFSKTGSADFGGSAGHAVGAAHFLHGGGRDGEELSTDTEQNDLFCLRRTWLDWGRQTHLAHSRGCCAADSQDALFDSGINIVDSKHLIDGSGFDGFGGHTKNHGRRFIL